MRIGIVTPAPPRSLRGNRVTALRWAKHLRELGHRVSVVERYQTQRFDLLIALHARRSAAAVIRFRRLRPAAPIIVVLTGTDLYADLRKSRLARRSLDLADRLVVAQPLALRALAEKWRRKARVVPKSAVIPEGIGTGLATPRPRSARTFVVCVLGHLRPVKDPFRTALAARRLPPNSSIEVHHFGAALTPGAARRARQEMRVNPRYRWHGEVPRPTALRHLANSRLMALTSRMEGGANVLVEALALGVPVLASRIDGSVGILGGDYPGYFPAAYTAALAKLLRRVETDAAFYRELRRSCRRLRPRVAPRAERQALQRLLRELDTNAGQKTARPPAA